MCVRVGGLTSTSLSSSGSPSRAPPSLSSAMPSSLTSDTDCGFSLEMPEETAIHSLSASPQRSQWGRTHVSTELSRVNAHGRLTFMATKWGCLHGEPYIRTTGSYKLGGGHVHGDGHLLIIQYTQLSHYKYTLVVKCTLVYMYT